MMRSVTAAISGFIDSSASVRQARRCDSVASRRPVDVDRQLGIGEDAADRIGATTAPCLIAASITLRFASPVTAIISARGGDDRRAAQRDARDRRLGRQRIGHHAERAALLRAVQRLVEIGAGEDRGGMAVAADAEQAQIERPVQILQQRIGRAARGLVIAVALSLTSGITRAPLGRKILAIAVTFDSGSPSGTIRSSVGMIVTRFQSSLAAASFS